jgi:hypothetical protein
MSVGGGREKKHFSVGPTWTNPNNHPLEGIVFLGELDVNNLNLTLMFVYFEVIWASNRQN